MKTIQIAVREFALPVPRKGSIEVHSGYGYLPLTGDEAHREVQQRRASTISKYKTEQRISHSFERGDYTFVVSGRIDGLIDSAPPYIEEIKTAFNVQALHEKLRDDPQHPYCLQVLTYAYIYKIQNSVVPACGLHLASYAVRKEFDLPIILNVSEYESWLEKRLDELVEEAKEREGQKKRRIELSKTMTFPFTKARPGQQDLIDAIERSFLSGSNLMVQAPTGIGKTAGVIFPSLRDALERGQKLVYVTPKNSQHQVAQDAIKKMQADGSEIRALTLTAKSKLCFKGEPVCDPELCEFAKDYYAKIHANDLVKKASKHQNMDAELFLELGKEYEVCPFELSVEAISRADVIIGDYNYVFAPRGLLGRFTGYGFSENARPNLAIDEAHNLPSRATGYFSPAISTATIDACRERVSTLPLDLKSESEALLHACLSLISKFQPRDRQKSAVIDPPAPPFLDLAAQLSAFLNKYMLYVGDNIRAGDPVIGLCREWTDFSSALAIKAEEFFCTFNKDTFGRAKDNPLRGSHLKITCCDASKHLSTCIEEFEHVVAFSATMKPFDYYQQLSGFKEEETIAQEFSSPFPTTNRKLVLIPQVSTKLNDRAKNNGKIAEAIMRILSVRTGNYFVFFPSFAFLRDVAEQVHLPGFNMLHQQQGMSAADVQKFIDSLRDSGLPTVIFAVQGGVFSEGVDYPGDMLIGAIIVGPALPTFDLEREKMREYYDNKFGQGFDFAYTFPAMARVVQAAGRVIRSETDRGLIVLMDKRFAAPSYSATMPGDWFNTSVNELVSKSILSDIKQFWTEGDNS